MIALKVKNFFVGFALIIFFIGTIPFNKTEAQFTTVEAPGPLLYAAGDTAIATGLTAAGVGVPLTEGALLGGFSAATDVACIGIDKSEEIVDTLDHSEVSGGSFATIGGSPALAAQISVALSALTLVKICRQAELTALSKLPIANLIAGQEQSRRQNDLSTEINALTEKITNLSAQKNAEIKDVLRAVMLRVILTTSKTLTTNLVNKMVEKYKISDYLAYGDALASQVYNMKYIDQNYAGDARTQMMLRSILQSKKFPEQIKTAQAFASSKAREYMTSGCQAMVSGYNDQSSGDFLTCLSAMGSEQSSPLFQFMVAEDQAQAASSYGKTAAAQELASSNGFAPPRDCSGSVSQQLNIDQQTQQRTNDLNLSSTTLSKMQDAYNKKQTSKEELDKAVADYKDKQSALDSLPKSLGSGVVDICKAISAPSQFVAESISNFLKGHLEQSTQLKSDNLPFYASFLSDVASNFLTNILTGGKRTGQVLKEAGIGALAGAVIGITQSDTATNDAAPTNPVGDVDMYITEDGQSSRVSSLIPGRAYTLHVGYANIADERPYRMLLSGFIDGTINENLASPQYGAVRDNEIQFRFDATNRDLSVTTQFFAQGTNGNSADVPIGSWNLTIPVARVAGAVTSGPIMPRGESRLLTGAAFQPRGN